MTVLILIIMEDTLRVEEFDLIRPNNKVLILIIMEDTLRVFQGIMNLNELISLNPYYNGRYSTSYLANKQFYHDTMS